MMCWNKTVTLYNRCEDEQGQVCWYRHKLDNCFYKATYGKANSGGVQSDTTNYIIRIPQQNNFLSPYDWLKLSDSLKGNYITLQGGDLIFLGSVDEDIDEYTQGRRSSDLIAKYHALGSVLVKSVNINVDLPGAHYLVKGE